MSIEVHMKHNLILVVLTQDQIEKAKEVNGRRKQFTHALICGPYGQIFGTEKHCRKYYSVWVNIFPHLFDKGIETESYEISDFKSTFNLVNKLIEIHDPLEKDANPAYRELEKITKKKKGFFARIFN